MKEFPMNNLNKKTRNLMALIAFSLITPLFGCGVTSGGSSSGNSGNSAIAVDSKTASPLDLIKMGNQKTDGAAPQPGQGGAGAGNEKDPEGVIAELYNALSSPNPATRKNAEQTLVTLAYDNDQFLDELKRLETENKNPDSWYSASRVLKNVEKLKAKESEEAVKQEQAAIAAANAAENN